MALRPSGPLAAFPLVVNLAYAAGLIVLATVPSLPGSAGGVPDGWAHGIGYGLQAALVYWMVFPIVSRVGAAAISWLSASILGCATEVMQVAIVERSAEFRDVAADMFGAAACIGAVTLARLLVTVVRGSSSLKGGTVHDHE